jgi:hypothetical protein
MARAAGTGGGLRCRVAATAAAGSAALLPVAVMAGAWTLEPGTGQIIVGLESKLATQQFDGKGERVPRDRFAKTELSAYGEYGLVDGLTVLFSPRVEDVNDSSQWGGARTGLGYTEIGARVRFVRFDVQEPGGQEAGSQEAGSQEAGVWRGSVVSLQGSVRIPGSVDDNDPLLIGNNVFEIDARLLFGTSFMLGSWSSFVNAEAGYRWRDGDPPSELRGDLTFGVRPRPDWLALAQVFQVTTVGGGSGGFRAGAYTRVQLSVVHDLDARWSLQVGANSVVAGRRALAENGVMLAVWRRF